MFYKHLKVHSPNSIYFIPPAMFPYPCAELINFIFLPKNFRFLMQVVVFCHDKDIVYRDLKPENILLATKPSSSPYKLADFGLATYIKLGKFLVFFYLLDSLTSIFIFNFYCFVIIVWVSFPNRAELVWDYRLSILHSYRSTYDLGFKDLISLEGVYMMRILSLFFWFWLMYVHPKNHMFSHV